MNRDILQGNWEEVKGKLRQTWGWLTDDDLEEIKGNQQEIYGKLQKHYGYGRNDAEKAVKDFTSNLH